MSKRFKIKSVKKAAAIAKKLKLLKKANKLLRYALRKKLLLQRKIRRKF